MLATKKRRPCGSQCGVDVFWANVCLESACFSSLAVGLCTSARKRREDLRKLWLKLILEQVLYGLHIGIQTEEAKPLRPTLCSCCGPHHSNNNDIKTLSSR